MSQQVSLKIEFNKKVPIKTDRTVSRFSNLLAYNMPIDFENYEHRIVHIETLGEKILEGGELFYIQSEDFFTIDHLQGSMITKKFLVEMESDEEELTLFNHNETPIKVEYFIIKRFIEPEEEEPEGGE